MRKTKRNCWNKDRGMTVGFHCSLMPIPYEEPEAAFWPLNGEDFSIKMRSLGMCHFVSKRELLA